jgi:hypothetical protein
MNLRTQIVEALGLLNKMKDQAVTIQKVQKDIRAKVPLPVKPPAVQVSSRPKLTLIKGSKQ